MGLLNLIARLSLNASSYEAGLRKAENLATRFGRNVSSSVKGHLAAAFGTGAILAATKNAIDYAGRVEDISTQLGISTEALQEFDFAAQQNGATLDDFARVLRQLAKSRAEALGDTKGALAQDFKRLGVSIEDLKTKKLDELLRQIGRSFKDIQNPQQILAAGLQTMGRSAGEILPAMVNDLDAAAKAARDIGAVIQDETITALDNLGDSLDELKMAIRGFFSPEVISFFRFFGTVFSLVSGTAKGIGAAVGAMSAGGDADQAFQLALDEHFMTRETARIRTAELRRQRNRRISEIGGDFSGAGRGDGSKVRIDRPNVNNLQQIGAYVGIDPLLMEQRKANVALSKIKDNTERMARTGFSRSEW